MNTKHGILTPEGVLLTIQANQWHTEYVPVYGYASLAELMQVGIDQGLTHLWVHASTGIDLPAPMQVTGGGFESKNLDGWNVFGQMSGKHIMSAQGWPLPHGDSIYVSFPHHSGWGKSNRVGVPGWASVATPKQLLVTISYLEKRLGVPVTSPSGTGWALHKMLHPEWAKGSPAMRALEQHFRESAGGNFTSQREYDLDEGRYVHKIDKNSAFLQGCKFDSFYGVGDPVQCSAKDFDGKSPGAWFCTVTPLEVELPGYEGACECWLATPLVRLLRSAGYEVLIHTGWFWKYEDRKSGRPSHAHQVMAKWAELVWENRQFFATTQDKEYRRKDCCEFATSAMKQIAVGTVGLTGFKKFKEDEDTDKRRPDIRAQTIARSYELMYWNILKFQEKTGLMPIMSYVDALYYVTDSPAIPFPEVFLSRQKDLGGYKYEGCIKITPEVEAILNDDTGTSKKLELLNQIGWRK